MFSWFYGDVFMKRIKLFCSNSSTPTCTLCSLLQIVRTANRGRTSDNWSRQHNVSNFRLVLLSCFDKLVPIQLLFVEICNSRCHRLSCLRAETSVTGTCGLLTVCFAVTVGVTVSILCLFIREKQLLASSCLTGRLVQRVLPSDRFLWNFVLALFALFTATGPLESTATLQQTVYRKTCRRSLAGPCKGLWCMTSHRRQFL